MQQTSEQREKLLPVQQHRRKSEQYGAAPDNDPEQEPVLSWRSSSNCIYTNWLNFVYQETPYDLSKLPPLEEESYVLHPPAV